ncbi:hypothetical protein HH214_04650 [Mucilaginibacter robiniae]|uniref:Uncharacterized protein n=1 Tax=Mucilaginibacter robiniae TaxID=2728022 RepID=A0A7L5E4E2_9SPHI|nr:hypothetical protein [Mucilaginibacter robiniae]QJD95216.1 hypothetical protein HH214_04650 [Mucilaginibacter robiniae]
MNTLTLSAAKVNFAYIPAINFAFQQNHVPVIREFTLQNQSDQNGTNVGIEITTEHDFADVWKYNIDFLSRGETYEFKSILLNVSSKYLAYLTERIASRITITINTEDDLVFQESYPVDLLAYDQWSGISLLPQMLACNPS